MHGRGLIALNQHGMVCIMTIKSRFSARYSELQLTDIKRADRAGFGIWWISSVASFFTTSICSPNSIEYNKKRCLLSLTLPVSFILCTELILGYAITDQKKYLDFQLKKYELESLQDDRITVAVEVCGVCGSVCHPLLCARISPKRHQVQIAD